MKKAGTGLPKFPLKELNCETVPAKEDTHCSQEQEGNDHQPSTEESLTKPTQPLRCKLGEGWVEVISTREKDKHGPAMVMFKDARTWHICSDFSREPERWLSC